ncbi:hypothetical protein HK096_005557 [Nowakowskiella sp. JEL0078]|nr:hypothetical protein HK096_005557 [Nowakowskiella sp. JEL0078]
MDSDSQPADYKTQYPVTWSSTLRVSVGTLKALLESGKDSVLAARLLTANATAPHSPLSVKVSKISIPRRPEITLEGLDEALTKGSLHAEWVEYRKSSSQNQLSSNSENVTRASVDVNKNEVDTFNSLSIPADSKIKTKRRSYNLGRSVTLNMWGKNELTDNQLEAEADEQNSLSDSSINHTDTEIRKSSGLAKKILNTVTQRETFHRKSKYKSVPNRSTLHMDTSINTSAGIVSPQTESPYPENIENNLPLIRESDRRVIMYVHGGAYFICSRKTYRILTSKLAKYSGARILAIDYRLSPEYVFPAALHSLCRRSSIFS